MPFTASVIERRFAYVPDKILCLGGAAWLRPFSLCASWGRLRIGVLCAVSPNGTSNISDVLFLLGMCAGSTAPGSAYSTSNFVGASLIGAATVGAARLLAYNAGSGNPYYSTTAGVAFRKQNTTFVTSSAAFASALQLPVANTGFYRRRAIVIVDIDRPAGGSGGLTINVYSANTATVQVSDFRPDHLFEALDEPGVPTTRQGTFVTNLTTTAVTYSPVGGDVDNIELFWSSAAFPLEISAIGATCWRNLPYSDAGVADDPFDAYTVSSGSITTQLSAGTGWSGDGVINSVITSNFAPQVYGQYAGTTYSPDETFEQYLTGTVTSSAINLGTYWAGTAQISTVTYNLAAQVFNTLAGTNLGAYDSFESYGTGAVVSGVTINGGGGFWFSAGSIY